VAPSAHSWRHHQQVIRGRKAAAEYVGIGKTQSYELERRGLFPRAIALGGPRSLGWLVSELDAWLQSRAAERDGVQ
jgi:prophage regulatory protein